MPSTTSDFATDPSSGTYQGDSSSTTGFHGHRTVEDDGTALIVGSETLTATTKDGGSLGHLTATQRRTTLAGVTTVEQKSYSYCHRDALSAELYERAPDDFGPAAEDVVATCFGKFDSDDQGLGSPVMKIVQTNSEVFGASIKEARLKKLFGADYKKHPKRLTSFVEVALTANGRFARVPLVDVGPGEKGVDLDLTIAVIKHLVNDPKKTDRTLAKNFKRKVKFRVVIA